MDYSDWGVMTQEDDPNPFPEGYPYASYFGVCGIGEYYKTWKEANAAVQDQMAFDKWYRKHNSIK